MRWRNVSRDRRVPICIRRDASTCRCCARNAGMLACGSWTPLSPIGNRPILRRRGSSDDRGASRLTAPQNRASGQLWRRCRASRRTSNSTSDGPNSAAANRALRSNGSSPDPGTSEDARARSSSSAVPLDDIAPSTTEAASVRGFSSSAEASLRSALRSYPPSAPEVVGMTMTENSFSSRTT